MGLSTDVIPGSVGSLTCNMHLEHCPDGSYDWQVMELTFELAHDPKYIYKLPALISNDLFFCIK